MTTYNTCLMALLFFTMPCLAQNVAINEDGSLPNANAILDIKSTGKGILIPRMSTADRLAIVAPHGLLVYDTATHSFWYNARQAASIAEVKWQNLATGTAWTTQGNMAENNSFLGTLNSLPLKILVNSKLSGWIDYQRSNTFLGYQAGINNTSDTVLAGSNTATGAFSLYANAGNYNTATGVNSAYSNTSGNYNTATGINALFFNTSGSGNTAIGAAALEYLSTGSNNTAIGFNARTNNGTLNNATAIGFGATVNASNKVRIGNSSVTVIEGQVPFTVPSDGRYKFRVKEDVRGLDFILQLRPVTYQFDVKRFNDQYTPAAAAPENSNGNYAMQAAYDEATSLRRSGFIAQEVEKAAIASGYNFSGIIAPKTAAEHYSLSYEAFVVPLVKAVQEQQETITAQYKQIRAQQTINDEQEKKIAVLQQQLDELKQMLQRSK